MAKTNKKKGSALLIIAIVLVAAALVYVVWSGLTSAVFHNKDLEKAVAQALDETGSIEKSDLEDIKYFEAANDGQTLSVFLGYDDFLEQRALYIEEQQMIADIQNANAEAEAAAAEAKENAETDGETTDETTDETTGETTDETAPVLQEVPEATIEHPVNLAKTGSASSTSALIDLSDIKHFKGAKVISLIGVEIDVDDLAGIKELNEISFQNCSIENFESFSKLNLSQFESISFYDCAFDSDNYDALSSISDKVTLTMSYDLGNGMIYPLSYTLTEILEQESADETTTNEATDETAPVD